MRFTLGAKPGHTSAMNRYEFDTICKHLKNICEHLTDVSAELSETNKAVVQISEIRDVETTLRRSLECCEQEEEKARWIKSLTQK